MPRAASRGRLVSTRAPSCSFSHGSSSPNDAEVNGIHPVFCTRTGAALSSGYVRRLLPALAQIAGIHKRVHAHGFRHTHAAQLRTEGVDIGIISKQLGHQSIATTARYLDHIAPVAVVLAIRERLCRCSELDKTVVFGPCLPPSWD